MKRALYVILCQLCLMALLTGCKGEQARTENTVEATAAPLEAVVIQSEVTSSTAITLTWKKLIRGTSYTLSKTSREDNSEYKVIATYDMQGEDHLGNIEVSENTMQYLDVDVDLRDGKEYLYKLEVACQYSELDYATYDSNRLWATKVGGTVVNGKVDSMDWPAYVSEYEYCNQVRQMDQITPNQIALYMVLNKKDGYSEPVGLEIYRGTHPDKLKKIDDIPYDKDKIVNQGKNTHIFVYEDKTVKTGETYYYQVRTYVGTTGEKVYGKRTSLYRYAAVNRQGDFSVDVLTSPKKFRSSLRIKITSQSSGNDTMTLNASNMMYLIDYVYETKKGDFHSISLQLSRYRENGGRWKDYQENNLMLKPGKKISLELTAKETTDAFVYPSRDFTATELIFCAKYNHQWQDFSLDLQSGTVFGDEDASTGYEIEKEIQKKNSSKQLSIQVNVKPDRVFLKWNSIEHADGYRILRAKQIENEDSSIYGKNQEIAVVSAKETTYTNSMENGETYQYTVQAFWKNGKKRKVLTEYSTQIYSGLMVPSVPFCRNSGNDGNFIQIPYVISEYPAVWPDGIEIYRGDSESSMQRIASHSLKKEKNFWKYLDAKYVDYDVVPGKNYYYSIRSYKDTENGREYSVFSEPCEKVSYLWYSKRYRMRILSNKKATEDISSFVVSLHSASSGNEDLCIDFSGQFKYYEFGSSYGAVEIRKYSYDGIHWKKMKTRTKVILSSHQTVYFQINSKEKLTNPKNKEVGVKIACEGVARRIVGNGYYAEYIDFTYDCQKDSLSIDFWSED